MRCFAAPYTRTTLLITEEATFYKDCDPLLALNPWCCPIILAWRFVYGALIWLYVTGWECLPLCVREDCHMQHGFNPNLSKRGPEDRTLLGWKCWYPSELVGFFYRILLVLCSLPISKPQKMVWRMFDLCNAPVIMSYSRKQF